MPRFASPAQLVDFAGRQRMLNQRMMKESLAERLGEPSRYQGTLALIRGTAASMRDGGELRVDAATTAAPSLPAPTPRLRELLDGQLRTADEVEAGIQLFLAAGPAEVAGALAELLRRGDRFHEVANETTREMAAYAQGLQQAAEQRVREVLDAVLDRASRLTETAGRLDRGTESMTGEAEQSVRGTEAQSASCRESSEVVQTMAAATEELNASIQEIARQLASSLRVSKSAVNAVHATSENLQKLGDDAGQIGRAAALISSVAEQTNVLALNATIEAARAGEHGKGFAIVAREVKELSRHTGAAAREIGDFLDMVRGESEAAVGAVREIAGLFDELDAANTTVATSMEEQNAAAKELARGLQAAAAQVDRIAAGAVAVSRSATAISKHLEESRHESTAVAGYATELRDWVMAVRKEG
jgi:methyl-accepting chemotaxis protein